MSAEIKITPRSPYLSRVSSPVWRADRADRGRTDREQRARVDLEQGCKVNSQLQQHEPFVIVLTAMIICLPMTAQAADETLTLACKGTVIDKDAKLEPVSMGIIVNFTNRTVQGSFGEKEARRAAKLARLDHQKGGKQARDIS